MRFIDQCKVILLDVNNTFMFDGDRFSATENFGSTYRKLGGQSLNDDEVRRLVLEFFDTMMKAYADPRYYESFPSVRECLEQITKPQGLVARERSLLDWVIAHHEVGTVPEEYVATLHTLAKTHRLGVVSNIWSRSDLYLREFERAGIRALFKVVVFSSDHRSIKPSPSLFYQALAAFDVSRSQVVFVGDSLQYDVAGARSVGLSTVWISPEASLPTNVDPTPDLIIRDLRELPAIEVSFFEKNPVTR